jgi:hypothetical protein
MVDENRAEMRNEGPENVFSKFNALNPAGLVNLLKM